MAFFSAFKLLRLALIAVALPGVAFAQQGPGGGGGPGGPGGGASQPTKAGYMVVEESEVPVVLHLTGRATAQNTTRIRPRVGGIITEILYSPGSLVQVGDPLFTIDPLNYQVGLAEAEADLARAEADLVSARTAYERAEQLRASKTASAASFETAETNLRKAEASLASAQAALKLAQAQMEWTTVRAPISGIVGLPEVSLGDLVTANQGDALTEIVQTDPVQIDLTEPYPLRLRLESRAAAGEITLTEPKLSLILDDGSRIGGATKLISTSATVSTTTGSRILRFELPNPDGRVAPGMFLHAELELARERAVLVPQRATTRERDGSLIAWIVDDGKARKRKLTESGTHGTFWVVQAGLVAGDHVLLDGTGNLREGQDVEPILATIDEQGVVRDATPAEVSN